MTEIDGVEIVVVERVGVQEYPGFTFAHAIGGHLVKKPHQIIEGRERHTLPFLTANTQARSAGSEPPGVADVAFIAIQRLPERTTALFRP